MKTRLFTMTGALLLMANLSYAQPSQPRDGLQSVKGQSDFYARQSNYGPLDPTDMNFDGIFRELPV